MSTHTFELPAFELAGGEAFPALQLVYTLHGEMNAAKDNVILFPTYYTGTHVENERLVGPGRALDTERYCIVIPNQFGNGQSSSPSNTSPPFDGPRFPAVGVEDNVRAQAELLDYLGVDRLAMVVGWSMGGVQAYHWCAQYPDRVDRALIICATAKTSQHNVLFLEGLKRALMADAAFAGGDYMAAPALGLRAFASVYCGWAFSQAFFRKELYRGLGFSSVDELVDAWVSEHLGYDANDLLCMLEAWQRADIGALTTYRGDLPSALEAIRANVWLMPCEQDLYFRHEDNREELKYLPSGKYCGFVSDYGHCAAGPDRFVHETQIIEDAVRGLLRVEICGGRC